MTHPFFEILEERMSDTSDVYVPRGTDPGLYLKGLADTIRTHRCEPIHVEAVVAPPGFPETDEGRTISGWCLAEDAGYWLVYQPEIDRFCCFWGTDVQHLSAPGIFGSPLYCWSA